MTMVHITSLYGFAAAVLAVTLEYLYKVAPGTWLSNLWYFLPLQLGISWLLYKMIQLPISLLEVFIVWTVSTAVLRIFVSVFLLEQYISNGVWAATAMLILARVVQIVWR